MSFTSLKTLKDLEKAVVPTQGTAKGVKKYFTLQSGDSFKIRFLQELTEDAKNFNEDLGTAITVPVITSPVNWKWRVASTASLEKFNYRCWATEQSVSDKAWRPKPHLLINVAVEIEPGTWEPRILDTTFNQRHIGLTLIEYAKEFGTITDREYKYSRTGSSASDTNYSLIPLNVSEPSKTIKDMSLHDLESVYMTLPYEKQQIFLTTGELNKDSW
jgi:hypothetical protein